MQDLTTLIQKGNLPPCALCQMRALGVCAKAGDDALAKFERHKIYRTYAAGSTIAYAGDELRYSGTIMTGVASMSNLLEDGRRQIIGLLHPGNFLGRPGKDYSSCTIEAITPVELCGFKRKEFESLLLEVPELHHRLLEMMLSELDLARGWMLTLGRKTARERVCSLLLHLVYQQNLNTPSGPPKGELVVDMVMTREQFGDVLALTLETVSRQFAQLGREGVINPIDRTVFGVPDLRKLLEAAGDDSDGDGLF